MTTSKADHPNDHAAARLGLIGLALAAMGWLRILCAAVFARACRRRNGGEHVYSAHDCQHSWPATTFRLASALLCIRGAEPRESEVDVCRRRAHLHAGPARHFFVQPDVSALVNSIEAGSFIMLSGPGGAGKTTSALCALQIMEHRGWSCFYVDCRFFALSSTCVWPQLNRQMHWQPSGTHSSVRLCRHVFWCHPAHIATRRQGAAHLRRDRHTRQHRCERKGRGEERPPVATRRWCCCPCCVRLRLPPCMLRLRRCSFSPRSVASATPSMQAL